MTRKLLCVLLLVTGVISLSRLPMMAQDNSILSRSLVMMLSLRCRRLCANWPNCHSRHSTVSTKSTRSGAFR